MAVPSEDGEAAAPKEGQDDKRSDVLGVGCLLCLPPGFMEKANPVGYGLGGLGAVRFAPSKIVEAVGASLAVSARHSRFPLSHGIQWPTVMVPDTS